MIPVGHVCCLEKKARGGSHALFILKLIKLLGVLAGIAAIPPPTPDPFSY